MGGGKAYEILAERLTKEKLISVSCFSDMNFETTKFLDNLHGKLALSPVFQPYLIQQAQTLHTCAGMLKNTVTYVLYVDWSRCLK